MKKKYSLVALAALVLMIPFLTLVAQAAEPNFGNLAFRNRWVEQDRLVGSPGVSRPYTWGPSIPEAPSALMESYNSSPGGTRQVQYFDKARMELNRPASGIVTAGLLTKELVSGLRQDGDTTFTQLNSSRTQVAGDSITVNPDSPVYESFKGIVTLGNPDDRSRPNAVGTPINTFINKAGQTSTLANPPENITIGAYEGNTGHNIAKPFQEFKQIRGPITEPVGGTTIQNQPIYTNDPTTNVFGLAISEPFWVNTRIAGADRTVLVQLFERRVLTYNPAIATGASKVEMGNLGQHYYRWRYVESTNSSTIPASAAPNNDYSQFRAMYNKGGGGSPTGGTGNIATYNANSNIYSSPAVDLSKNLAVFGTETNGLHGVNTSGSGNTLNNVFIFKPVANPSFNSDPLIFNGTIYAGGGDGRVYAIDVTSTGTSIVARGQTAPAGAEVSGSVAISPDAKQLYYSAGSSLYAVDLADLATRKWAQNLAGTLSAPALDSAGNIFVTSTDSKLYAFKADGTVLNSNYPITVDGGMDNIVPAVVGGAVYISNEKGASNDKGGVFKINPDTGTYLWIRNIDLNTDGETTIAVAGGAVYIGTDGNKVLKIDEGTGTLQSTFMTSATVHSSIAVVDGFYYFGDDSGKVYKVDLNRSSNSSILLTGADSFYSNSPVVADGKLYIASSTGTFYLIK